jgi:methylated-DNA-[protein]-cysteine S-methyltransferase
LLKKRGEHLLFYETVCSSFGEIGIVWTNKEKSPLIVRIFIPAEDNAMSVMLQRLFPNAERLWCDTIKNCSLQIQDYLKGTPIDFSLDCLDMSYCYKLQERVLLANRKIPRGKVRSYGDLAEELHVFLGARVVGTALAKNPFPLVIPCHRVVKGNRDLGGFDGGLKMKRALLEMEGIKFDASGKVCRDYLQLMQ